MKAVKDFVSACACYVSKSFLEESHRWILWLPVMLGSGMLIYFRMQAEYNPLFAAAILILLILLAWGCGRFYGNDIVRVMFAAAAVLAFGYVYANVYSLLMRSPRIEKRMDYVMVEGVVLEMNLVEKGDKMVRRFVLGEVAVKDGRGKGKAIAVDETPKKIRVNVRTPDNGAQIGDRVAFRATLVPLSLPLFPRGYDFAENAFFKQIGATGYSVSPFEIVKKANWRDSLWVVRMNRLRNDISQRIIARVGKRNGSVVAALITGDKTAIAKDDIENIRHSGMAHLIAISGLHLTIVTGLFFFVSRFLLSLSQYAALHWNIKKIAAVAAIFGGFCYLLITGFPISAERAFLMALLVLAAILLDKQANPLRSVALAAIVVLLAAPNVILSPSFHMSFAAVVGLISFYELMAQKEIFMAQKSFAAKFLFYVAGIIVSSLIAEAAITPFSVYHFNIYSGYGIAANLIAIPLTTFFIMPLCVVAMILMGAGSGSGMQLAAGLEGIALDFAAWGVGVILDLAKYIVALPYATHVVGVMPRAAILLMSLGLVWICLWSRPWRLLGAGFAFVGIMIAALASKPDIIIDQRKKDFVVYDEMSDRLVSNRRIYSRFRKDVWTKRMGVEKVVDMKKLSNEELERLGLVCGKHYCTYLKNGRAAGAQSEDRDNEDNRDSRDNRDNRDNRKKNIENRVYFALTGYGLKIACKYGKYVVNLSRHDPEFYDGREKYGGGEGKESYGRKLAFSCVKPEVVIKSEDILKDGVHTVYLNGDGEIIRIENVVEAKGDRIW